LGTTSDLACHERSRENQASKLGHETHTCIASTGKLAQQLLDHGQVLGAEHSANSKIAIEISG
jgi:hypothetical protein